MPGGTQSDTAGRHVLRADALRALLRQRGITQTALAARMGMDRGYINQTLMAHRAPSRLFLYALRDAFPDDYDNLVDQAPDTDPTGNPS